MLKKRRPRLGSPLDNFLNALDCDKSNIRSRPAARKVTNSLKNKLSETKGLSTSDTPVSSKISIGRGQPLSAVLKGRVSKRQLRDLVEARVFVAPILRRFEASRHDLAGLFSSVELRSMFASGARNGFRSRKRIRVWGRTMIFYNAHGDALIVVLRNAYMCGEVMTGDWVYEKPFWDNQMQTQG